MSGPQEIPPVSEIGRSLRVSPRQDLDGMDHTIGLGGFVLVDLVFQRGHNIIRDPNIELLALAGHVYTGV